VGQPAKLTSNNYEQKKGKGGERDKRGRKRETGKE